MNAVRFRLSLMLLAALLPCDVRPQDGRPHHGLEDIVLVEPDPWADYDTDSFVTMRVKRSDRRGSETCREKRLVRGHDRGRAEVWRIREKKGKFPLPTKEDAVHVRKHVSARYPHELGFKEAPPRKGAFTLGARKLPCVIQEFIWSGDDGKQEKRVSIWKCKGLRTPYREVKLPSGDLMALRGGVVRAVYAGRGLGVRSELESRIEALRVPVKVGTDIVSLICVVERVRERTTAPDGKTVTARRWLSDQVPGRLVRLERETRTKEAVVFHEEQMVEFAGAHRNAIIRPVNTPSRKR
jgi:hypothetical protein